MEFNYCCQEIVKRENKTKNTSRDKNKIQTYLARRKLSNDNHN